MKPQLLGTKLDPIPSPIRYRLSLALTDVVTRAQWESLLKSEKNLEWISAYSCGDRAVECLPFDKPMVILLDVFLRGCNGFDCARQLRPKFPHAKIILVSELYDALGVHWAKQATANGFLMKPLTAKYLINGIHFASGGGFPGSPEDLWAWPGDLPAPDSAIVKPYLKFRRPHDFASWVWAVLCLPPDTEPIRLVHAAIARSVGYHVANLIVLCEVESRPLTYLFSKTEHKTPSAFLHWHRELEHTRLTQSNIIRKEMADQLGLAHAKNLHSL